MILFRQGCCLLIVVSGSIGFVVAAAWSIRVGCADYWIGKGTVTETERAIALSPGQAIYYRRLAFLVAENQPERAIQGLERAVILNPDEASSWIELGLHYEARGDLIRAEGDLLRAAAVDKQYLPRWSLANYYFRQNDLPRFWFWAKETASMLYGDPLPLFRLCGNIEEDGNLLDRLDIRDPEIRAAYLSYLLSINRLDLIEASSRKVLEENRKSDTLLLLTLCDRLLAGNHVEQAIVIWNKLAANKKIPFEVHSLASNQLLTNGKFSVEPISSGFDWRLSRVDGISMARENPEGLRLTFSGDEPENSGLLTQYVPLQENRAYRLRFLYRTSGVEAGTGIAWHITDMKKAIAIGGGSSLSSDDETQGEISFATPPGCSLVRISLDYGRSPGTTRIAGYVILRSVELFALA